MVKKNCQCEIAVKNAYTNLIKRDVRPSDALYSAMRILKYYHPEMPEQNIHKKAIGIINPELKRYLYQK